MKFRLGDWVTVEKETYDLLCMAEKIDLTEIPLGQIIFVEEDLYLSEREGQESLQLCTIKFENYTGEFWEDDIRLVDPFVYKWRKYCKGML